MVIFGDKTKPVYEIEVASLNPLTGRYERCWDYVHASDADEARANARWIYGQSMEIISISLDTYC